MWFYSSFFHPNIIQLAVIHPAQQQQQQQQAVLVETAAAAASTS